MLEISSKNKATKLHNINLIDHVLMGIGLIN